jgi:IS5 family transposase
VPDAKTIWVFKNTLAQQGIIELLFKQFTDYLKENGFAARKGQIIDASIIQAPKQRNTREENEIIKTGKNPESWSKTKERQKDTDARWTIKNKKRSFGYKNHISVDVKHKFIRTYDVTSASVHDSNVFECLLDNDNTRRDVYADSAYRSKDRLDHLEELGYRCHIQRKGYRNKKLSPRENQGNRTRSRIRCRVEHVFGIQKKRTGDLIVRSIGIVRASYKIGLRNLVYNFTRYKYLLSSEA